MSRRYYSSIAVPTTLSSGVTDSGTTFALAASTGFPSSYPFTLIVDEDTAYEEVVTVTASLGGNSFTVTRGSDGTTAQAHSAGAAARHGFSSRDLDEPNAHIAASAAVHGLTGTVVGTTDTQVLTNKTLTSPTINGGTITGATMSITQPTLQLKQSAAPTPTTEGVIEWDSDDNTIKVGDGTTTKTFSDDSVTAANLAAHGADTSTHGVAVAVVGTTDTQTLTNKTLTSPTITDPTITGGTVPVTSVTGIVGAITAYAGSTAPSGFLLCNGASLLRADYPALFAVIDVTYGSVDGTHFNVPDLRGRVAVGVDNMGGVTDAGRISTANTLGTASGTETKTLTTTELPAHTHTGTTSTNGDHYHQAYEENGAELSGSGESYMVDYTEPGPSDVLSAYTSTNGAHNHTFTTDSSGSGAAFNIMQPYITLNYIIKY